jgi:inosine/xanthosine triphosphatase
LKQKPSIMSKITLVVGSENPVKKCAARDAYMQVFFPEIKGVLASIAEAIKDRFNPDEITIIGERVPSGVSEQPMSEEETRFGAVNRLVAVREKYKDADGWVAIEGGIIIRDGLVYEIGCVAVSVKNSYRISINRAIEFEVPTKTADLIKKGYEMGPANDLVFGIENSKQSGGMAGIITNDLVVRYDLYYTPLLIAFSQFKNAHLYQ